MLPEILILWGRESCEKAPGGGGIWGLKQEKGIDETPSRSISVRHAAHGQSMPLEG